MSCTLFVAKNNAYQLCSHIQNAVFFNESVQVAFVKLEK